MTKYSVIEIFGPTIQGEGALCGALTHFIRLAGCDFRCTWCDSMHAVDPRQIKKNREVLAAQDIMDRIYELDQQYGKPPWVTISGGNPALHNCSELVVRLVAGSFSIAVETQGSYPYADWLFNVHHLTISPKPPSSGMSHVYADLDTLIARAHARRTSWCLKIVVFTPEDVKWADYIYRRYRRRYEYMDFFLSVGTEIPVKTHTPPNLQIADSLEQLMPTLLATTMCKDPNVRIIPQVHTLLWGSELGR